MLRYRADRKTLIYMMITMGVLYLNWQAPQFNLGLFLLGCFMAVTVSVMAHNHNHLPIWKNQALNKFQDYWITCFYGYPTFGWIATHNQNHHVLNNRPGDDSITWRHTEKNNLWSFLSYPAVSGYYQQAVNVNFIKQTLKKKPKLGIYYLSQIAILALFTLFFLFLDWKKGLLYVVIPQQVGLNAVLLFNYIQHVHADEESKYNHTRNITGRLLNFLLFNNGYHYVHHEKPLRHWSLNQAAHAEIADKMSPRLTEKSFWWYHIRVYILGIFFKRCRTQSMRLERIAKEKTTAPHSDVALEPAPSF